MTDHLKPSSTTAKLWRSTSRWLRHPFTAPPSESRELFQDILRQSSQTQSLDELVNHLPERICSALQLASFHLFILEQDISGQHVYRLLSPSVDRTIFPASSATVARMKRERGLSKFNLAPNGAPDAWQLLATPDEIGILVNLKTQFLLPLEGRTRLVGFVSLSRLLHCALSSSELRFLRELGPKMGRGLETALLAHRISQQAVERDRAMRELSLAREVQEHLLPRTLPKFPGIDLATFYQSAEQVGGDYYDVFPTISGSLCLVIADVSGKGIPAALIMSSLRASVHALMLQSSSSLPQVIANLNDLLHEASSASRYATLFICIYNPESHLLEYLNAGHNAPILNTPDAPVKRLTAGGPVVGLLPHMAYISETIFLHPGSTLIAYTDGITEALNSAGAEWSESGLEGAVRNAIPSEDVQHLVEHIRMSHLGFTAGLPPNDDMTLVVLRRST